MAQRRFSQAKILILGGSGVGKTAFTVRYITKRYIGDYAANTESKYNHRLPNEVAIEILDTMSEMSEETRESHIRWADGVMLLFSVTDRSSYQTACKIKDKVFHIRGPDLPLVLVANKHDLLTARAVTEDECENLAAECDCPRFLISVAEGQDGVNEAMEELLILVKRQYVKEMTQPDQVVALEKKSRLYNMKKAFKKRIVRSRSDTF